MTHFEIWILAAGLAMDCFAVAVAGGMMLKKMELKSVFWMTFLFGLFQALNPLLGWLATSHFRYLIESIDHWLAFGILGFLGGRMIVESFRAEECRTFNPRSLKVVLTMSVATSIDALAVGISFTCIGYTTLASLIYPLVAIGVVASAFTLAGLYLGVRFGCGAARKMPADFVGGLILVFIGVRVLIEHLSSNI